MSGRNWVLASLRSIPIASSVSIRVFDTFSSLGQFEPSCALHVIASSTLLEKISKLPFQGISPESTNKQSLSGLILERNYPSAYRAGPSD